MTSYSLYWVEPKLQFYEALAGSLNLRRSILVAQGIESRKIPAFTFNKISMLRATHFVYTEDVGSSSLSSPTIFFLYTQKQQEKCNALPGVSSA